MQLTDFTIEAQKILSSIYRMKHPYGIQLIIQVLLGEDLETIRRFGFHRLTTFGIMKGYHYHQIELMIIYLIHHRYLDRDPKKEGVSLAPRAYAVLKGEEMIPTTVVDLLGVLPYDEKLYQILREFRLQQAKALELEVYQIMRDVTLKEICRKFPTTRQGILNISGVGSKGYRRWGKALLITIIDYLHGIQEQSSQRKIFAPKRRVK